MTSVSLRGRRQAGFSLIELLVAVIVAIVLLAVSLPMFLRAYHSYQLTNAARQVADILRLTRYEAIRLNQPVQCVMQPVTGDPTLIMSASMADAKGNALLGMGAAKIYLGITGTLVASAPGSVPTQASLGTSTPSAFPVTGGNVQFDARGSVVAPAGVSAFYLASPAAPDAGYRVVFLLPAGSMQMWTVDTSGNWAQQR